LRGRGPVVAVTANRAARRERELSACSSPAEYHHGADVRRSHSAHDPVA